MPQFSQNKKGYDPEEVDKFVNEQLAQLQTAIQRAATAEAQLSIANSNLENLQRKVDELDASISEDTIGEATIKVTMPSVEETLGQQIQSLLNAAAESAGKIEQAAHEEAQRIVQKAQEDLNELQIKAQSLDDQMKQARTEADMIRSEAKAELDIELKSLRDAAEMEISRRRAELETLEQNREQEMRLRLEDKQGQLMKEHDEKMAALAAERQSLETQITSLIDQKEKAIADLANLQNMLRQAVGGINIPGAESTIMPVPNPEAPTVDESANLQEKLVDETKPKIEPMGASSVPFEEDQGVSNSNAGINGDEKVMMVPTIAGMAAIPMDSTGEPSGIQE
jgi:cell division septum initiation protein DivIVA